MNVQLYYCQLRTTFFLHDDSRTRDLTCSSSCLRAGGPQTFSYTARILPIPFQQWRDISTSLQSTSSTHGRTPQSQPRAASCLSSMHNATVPCHASPTTTAPTARTRYSRKQKSGLWTGRDQRIQTCDHGMFRLEEKKVPADCFTHGFRKTFLRKKVRWMWRGGEGRGWREKA